MWCPTLEPRGKPACRQTPEKSEVPEPVWLSVKAHWPSELMAALRENFEKNHERHLMGFQVATQPLQGSGVRNPGNFIV